MRSLFAKLFLAHLATLAIALLIFSLLLSNAFETLYAHFAQRQMAARAQEMANALASAVSEGKSHEELQELIRLLERATHTQICLTLAGCESEVVGTGEGGRVGGKPGRGVEEACPGTAVTLSGRAVHACGEAMVMASAALPGDLGVLQVRAPYADVVEMYVSRLRGLVLYAGVVAAVVAAFIALFLAERFAGPLRSMRSQAARMAAGDFSQRLGLKRRDEIGALAGSFDSMADSLERSLADLQHEQARLRGVVSSVAEGIIAIDSQGKISLINPQASNLLGIEQQAVGLTVGELGLPEKVGERFKECLKQNQMCSIEVEIGEQKRAVSIQVAPMRASEEGRWGAVAVLRDVTEARRLEEMRSRFISDASHEIRTPLTAIGGFAAAIADGTADTEQARVRCASLIVREVDRLNRLTNDLLDLSRIESGAVKLKLRPVDMGDLIREAVDSFETQIRERGMAVELDLSPGLPPVNADADRIHQVLVNLISNAIRFSRPQGRIRIAAQVRDGWLQVEVEDNGAGIPEDQLPHIWERFRRVDSSRAREAGGTGLGLAIVRSIISAHGGTVSARSVVGKGSTFTFALPLE